MDSVFYGVSKGSVFAPLLFLIYISDLNLPIKVCKAHHFVNEKNLLHFSKSITKLNKCVNCDMEDLTDWLTANKISLNMQKTELVFFEHQRKKIDSEVKN